MAPAPHPAQIIRQRVLGNDCAYSPTVRLVAVAVAEHLNAVADDEGGYSAWPSQTALARETGTSRRTVQRALSVLCDGPCPMFARTQPGRTRRGGQEFRHTSARLTLVTDPAAFAARRDQNRERRKRDTQVALLEAIDEPGAINTYRRMADSSRPPGPQDYAKAERVLAVSRSRERQASRGIESADLSRRNPGALASR